MSPLMAAWSPHDVGAPASAHLADFLIIGGDHHLADRFGPAGPWMSQAMRGFAAAAARFCGAELLTRPGRG